MMDALERNGNGQHMDDLDDEIEMTEFYSAGAGSQSVDCEASPPSMQVRSVPHKNKNKVCHFARVF